MKLNHIAVFSQDLERTIAFYQSIFEDIHVKYWWEEDPVSLEVHDDFWIAIFVSEEKNVFEHFALEVDRDTFDQYVLKLKSLWIYDKTYTHDFPYKALSVYTETPDGYDIEIFTKN